jgi:prepilin-type N-terminal cleavage/methylation domain-containing protein
MLPRDNTNQQAGFTLVELIVVMVITLLLSASLLIFATTAFKGYFTLQTSGTAFGALAQQSQRVAAVIRGLTDITEATSNDLTIYAYFYPTDTYVSLVHYYKSANGGTLYADVTPMTANPPQGTPITAQKKTYTITDSLIAAPGLNTFVYLDSAGNTLATPISDLHTIKGIQINLAVPGYSQSPGSNNTLSLQVTLRNRKTNL